MKQVGCGWLSARDGSRVSHRKMLADPNKTRQLVLRETAFVHKEYKNYLQLTHGLIQAESHDLRARSTYVRLLGA